MGFSPRTAVSPLAAAGERAFPGNGSLRDEELARLRKENARLRGMGHPAKSSGYLLQTAEMQYGFMVERRSEHRVGTMA